MPTRARRGGVDSAWAGGLRAVCVLVVELPPRPDVTGHRGHQIILYDPERGRSASGI
jgi:hypothetical protein